MLERTTKSYFEDILSNDFNYLERQDLISLDTKRSLRCKLRKSGLANADEGGRSSDERTMTRKTRTRRPRIPAIQSGYCAVCTVPYNSVEDHIQSKKHLKLIGEDANYIALNGSLNGFLQTNSIPFLHLNGIDAIGVHETSLDDFSPKYKRRAMPRTRAVSVVSDRVTKASPLSPTGSDITGHHLRSRRNINYMTPPLDDDSLQDKLEISLPEKRAIESVHPEYKEYRELRSSTRALAKLTGQITDHHDEVWNSGRPKRACIRHKRVSADDRLVSDNKTYYKVEVLSSKPRSTTNHERDRDAMKTRQSHSSRQDDDEKEKGLIVKFKKLRNSELIQLNNEATNFLFPKKEESSEEDDEDETDNSNSTPHLTSKNDSSDTEDCPKIQQSFKVEDEVSMDSTSSENKRKKKRRTHAEAFIMDNQKYYKFETPGSRLRYQGSYLPSITKSPKHGNDCSVKREREDLMDEPKEKPRRTNTDSKVVLDKYKFSFEKVPQNTAWYSTFQRIDKGEQRYPFFSDYYYWDPFILPYQMPSLAPLDPNVCMTHYSQLLKCIREPSSETGSTSCSTPDLGMSTHTSFEEDEDSKMSAATMSSTCSVGEVVERKRRGRRPRQPAGKNPRKSPRQHASTLAILSSLLQQRKRRARNKILDESLPAIPEEATTPQVGRPPKLKTPLRGVKPKIDYVSVARQIDEELDLAWEDNNLEELQLEPEEESVDFHRSQINVKDILTLYEEEKAKEDERSCRRFFNGTPGRKPGRRKKKNKTGWPNKNKRLSKKGPNKEKEDDNDDSTIDSVSVNMDSDEEEDSNSTDSAKKAEQKSDVVKEEDDRVDKIDKVLTNKVTNRTDFQPYVCVQKLDSNKLLGRQISGPKRTNRRQRRMPGSPKSPRMLRKPRGRWYRER